MSTSELAKLSNYHRLPAKRIAKLLALHETEVMLMSGFDVQNCYLKDDPLVWFFDQHFQDLSHTIFKGDIDFYRSLASETDGSVLELGSGTGRVAIPISLDGKHVVGLEMSPHMLSRAIEKAGKYQSGVEFKLGDMTKFSLRKKFGLIYIAFGAFHHLETVEDQLRCLDCVKNHLRTSGLFVIHIRNPPIHKLTDQVFKPTERHQLIGIDEITNERVLTESVSQRVNPGMQWIVETLRHTRFDKKGNKISVDSSEFKLRWIYYAEMMHLLIRSGFEPIDCFSDFLGNTVKDEVQQIWISKRL